MGMADDDDTTTVISTTVTEEVQSDLVSDFFGHIKEIFEPYEVPFNSNEIPGKSVQFNLTVAPAQELLQKFRHITKKRNKILAMFVNSTSPSTKHFTFKITDPEIIKKYKLIKSTKLPSASGAASSTQKQDRKSFAKQTLPKRKLVEQDELESETLGPIAMSDPDGDVGLMDQQMRKLACIFCDNVNNKDCNNPSSKLLPLIRCNNGNDRCYSMQTPFGIVDRGCFNRLSNLTTYVCSCNLCNSIPMHELPYTYTNKTEWLYNVQELTHGRRLRNSVYNQMACIHCEVNQTVHEVPDINCLEGKYRVLPSQYCNVDEVCGIRSLKSEGYIWRGCIKFPRYNYLFNFCDNDLCNFNAATSLFDIE
ncbi:uncharacterized protein LOC125229306 [Leguminivora glycinivorella]|uniref:uncharacterized protein LOC125229306 n=1 Tax=Leguminivora glycinivorella TaxID=1035111 RepID=UPI00200F8D75|nr:uncharacterized protein LOC125229306 [Leguminivora glycinivorella]